MNETQAIFTLFFAISWGIVSNVLWRWKPFHFAMFGVKGFMQPTYRALLAFLVLNVLPWLTFAVVIVWLSGPDIQTSYWSHKDGLLLIPRAMLPGLIPFGFYRVFQAVVRGCPDPFYAKRQSDVPAPFGPSDGDRDTIIRNPMEPDQESLQINSAGACKDFTFGSLYILTALLPLLV